MVDLTIQVHHGNRWHDAARVSFKEPGRGIRGATILSYEDAYFFEIEAYDRPGTIVDCRAVSVLQPVSLDFSREGTWPSWLLDLMPQGMARVRIAREAGLRPDDPAVELQLLLRAGGAPIGNLRIGDAWEAEQGRIEGVDCPPLDDRDIDEASERFLEVVNRFAHLASGSSGVQGEWPKALMTRSARDGFWYPDPFVPTHEGIAHMIVKLLKSTNENDTLILASEAPYLEMARAFGIRVASPLGYRRNVLRIPRFDRSVTEAGVDLHGQESLVSALGVAEFGHIASHEDYLQVIRRFSDDPAADTLEYIKRDLLNLATGNPDNHGRNTALTKPATGGVRLSPLFDYAPMRLSDAGIARVTNWRCMDRQTDQAGFTPICKAAACDGLSASDIQKALVEMLPLFRDLRHIAANVGIPSAVVEAVFSEDRVIKGIEAMEDAPCRDW